MPFYTRANAKSKLKKGTALGADVLWYRCMASCASYNVKVKNMGSGNKLPKFGTQLCHFLAMCHCINYLSGSV